MVRIFLGIFCFVSNNNFFIKVFALSCVALSTSAKTPNIKPVYSTICAETSDGNRRTFKTKCAMNNFNCNEGTDYEYVMDGPCCAIRCRGDVYDPICAEDLNGVRRTFTSQCQLDSLICDEGIGSYKNIDKF